MKKYESIVRSSENIGRYRDRLNQHYRSPLHEGKQQQRAMANNRRHSSGRNMVGNIGRGKQPWTIA